MRLSLTLWIVFLASAFVTASSNLRGGNDFIIEGGSNDEYSKQGQRKLYFPERTYVRIESRFNQLVAGESGSSAWITNSPGDNTQGWVLASSSKCCSVVPCDNCFNIIHPWRNERLVSGEERPSFDAQFDPDQPERYLGADIVLAPNEDQPSSIDAWRFGDNNILVNVENGYCLRGDLGQAELAIYQPLGGCIGWDPVHLQEPDPEDTEVRVDIRNLGTTRSLYSSDVNSASAYVDHPGIYEGREWLFLTAIDHSGRVDFVNRKTGSSLGANEFNQLYATTRSAAEEYGTVDRIDWVLELTACPEGSPPFAWCAPMRPKEFEGKRLEDGVVDLAS